MPDQERKEEEFSLKQYFVPLTTLKAIHFIVIIGLILFLNGLFNNFVADDPPEITENLVIHSFQNFPEFFKGGLFYMGPGQKLGGSFYRPLQSVHFSLVYTIFGPSFVAFHFFQILLFIINACLVFLLFKHFLSKPIAFVLSLLFLVHPINSESAFYISATQEVLFLFFGLIALWILKNYKFQKALVIASLSLFCSILSKETGILFFLISWVYIFLYNRKKIYYFLGYSLSFLGIYFLLRISAIGIIPATTKNAPIQHLNLLERMINIPEMFLFYLKTFIFPRDLSVMYHWVYTKIDFQHFFFPLVIDILFLGIVFSIAYILYRKFSQKYFTVYIFFLFWFLVGMLLHMQILPLDQTVTNQWFYFPMIGLLGMIGVLLKAYEINLSNKYIFILLTIIFIILSVRTFIRSFDWRDDFTLSSHDIKVSKEAYALEHQLSHIYFERGQYQEAKTHAERSINLYPTVFNYTDLGNAYFFLGEYPKAKEAYIKAIKYGDNYVTYDNLSGIAINYGDPIEGIGFIKNIALKKYPFNQRLWLHLAILEYKVGNKEEAKNAIQKAYQYNQGIPEVVPVYEKIINNQPLNYKVGNNK